MSTDDEGDDDPQPPKRRRRAPMFYKQYLQRNSDIDVPRTTFITPESERRESPQSNASVNEVSVVGINNNKKSVCEPVSLRKSI